MDDGHLYVRLCWSFDLLHLQSAFQFLFSDHDRGLSLMSLVLSAHQSAAKHLGYVQTNMEVTYRVL